MYSSTWGLGYAKDVEEGIWLFDLFFTMPFNFTFDGENRFVGSGDDGYYADYADRKSDERFYYWFKPYGESDFGDFTPHSLRTAVYYGYRGTEGYVHSFGLTFSAPLGVKWIRNENPDIYDPRPDPDHWSWSGALVYGLEFSKSEYPVFLALSLPIHAKPGELNSKNEYDDGLLTEWKAPDWEDILQRWTFAIGFKSAMF